MYVTGEEVLRPDQGRLLEQTRLAYLRRHLKSKWKQFQKNRKTFKTKTKTKQNKIFNPN